MRVSVRCRNIRHNALKNFFNVGAHLRGNFRRVLRRNADDILNFVLGALRVCTRQVNFVDDRQHLQIVLDCEIGVCERLCFDALCGIDNENSAFACRQGAGYLIVKVDVTRRVDEIHLIGLAVRGIIVHANRARLDGNAALALQIHTVQQLALHFALGNGMTFFQQAVSQRGFAVVDVRDDGEITD